MNFICRFKFAQYNILNNRTVKQGEAAINLYSCSIEDRHLTTFNQDYKPFHQYFQLLPFFLEKFLFKHKKQFVTKMDFHRESNLLKLTCLTHSGLFQKFVNVENMIPVTFGDYKNSCSRNLFRHCVVIDHEMIYYNRQQDEFYLFDRQGQWTETQEEGLSLGKLWDERKFQDQYFI